MSMVKTMRNLKQPNVNCTSLSNDSADDIVTSDAPRKDNASINDSTMG
jgi:hypothetical protein